MEYAPLLIDPRVLEALAAEKRAWRGIDLTKTGKIGEGLYNKTRNDYLVKSFEKFKNIVGDTQYYTKYIKFQPVSEDQLVKTATPSNMFSKGSFPSSRHLLYKVHKAEAKLVRSILERSGFCYTDSHDWNVMWLACNAKLYLYEGLNASQRINHFPNSYEITRKDRMCYNLMNMQKRYGPIEFGFFPETYIMPNEYNEFCMKYRNDKDTKWIVKPANSSQGRGIYLLDNFASLRTSDASVVSRFIHNPLLINDLKFDLRIYVLVTSFEPLKIYVFDEGLARFASEKYSNFSRANKFSFLTNYSINKNNENFIQNEDCDKDNYGHKWSLSALVKYLESANIDTSIVILKIYDLIIKTVITAENTVVNLVRKYNLSRNNCFDLFGFDILLDSNLKPWLLEVNLSPSLATESPLDLNIKGHLVAELFNIIGLRAYDRRAESAKSSRVKSNFLRPSTATVPAKDDKLTETFKDSVEEFLRAEHFVRIFPVEGCQLYDKYFTVPRKVNKGLMQFLFGTQSLERVGQFVITGEDMLVEYLTRIVNTCSRTPLIKKWESVIAEFVSNEIWEKIGLFASGSTSLLKLTQILMELKKRNLQVSKENEDPLQKAKIIQRFTASEIENALKSSRAGLNSLVLCFFKEEVGILTQMQTLTSQTPKKAYVDLKFIISKHRSLE